MIPIKITCGCGQKYAFDVEPSEGGVGCAVQCPVCGADGSEAANLLIAEHTSTRASGLQVRKHASAKPIDRSSLELPMAPRLPSYTPTTRGRKAWFIPALAGSGVVVLLLVVAGILSSRIHAKKPIPTAPMASAPGEWPHTLADLNSWYVEPAKGENAAEFNLRAFSALRMNSFKLLPPTAPMPAGMKSVLRNIVDSNRESLQLLREGAKREHSRYPVDLTLGFETMLPHLVKLRDAAKLEQYASTLHAEEHQGKEAGEDVLSALALGRSLASEPVLLSQFVRAASISPALGALEQTLNRTALPPETLSALAGALQQLESSEARGDAFNRALTGERATALSVVEAPQKYLQKLTGPGSAAMMKPEERQKWIACLQNAGNFKAEVQYYETTFSELMSARGEPFPARLKTDAFIRRRTIEAKNSGMALNNLLMPGRVGTAAKEAECLAQFRLGVAAIALEKFRMAHEKRYPAALSELPPQHSPDALIDPFDGQPLRYQEKGAGYLLYSVGPNLSDDSGERTRGQDIVFEVSGFSDAK